MGARKRVSVGDSDSKESGRGQDGAACKGQSARTSASHPQRRSRSREPCCGKRCRTSWGPDERRQGGKWLQIVSANVQASQKVRGGGGRRRDEKVWR